MTGTKPVNAKNEITCVRCSDAASQMFRTQGVACGQTLAPSEATMRDDAGKRKLKVVKNEERASDLVSNSMTQTGLSRRC
jgi:hypothetical protein